MQDLAAAVRRAEAIVRHVRPLNGRLKLARRAAYGRRDAPAAAVLVRIACKACGNGKVATVERSGRYLVFVTRGRRYDHPGAVACPKCGPLAVDYGDVEVKAAAAEPGRPGVLRARPDSTR